MSVRGGVDDGLDVVAHADQLGHAVRQAVVGVDGRRLELHRLDLACDVGALEWSTNQSAPRESHTSSRNELSCSMIFATRSSGRDPLLDHLYVAVDDHAAVEGGDRRPQIERFDRHRHALGRPAGQREQHTGVRRDQRRVDVGQDEPDRRVGHPGRAVRARP